MKITSIFQAKKKNTRKNNLIQRGLRLESLEQRQMLTAVIASSPENLMQDEILDAPAIIQVTTEYDIVDDADGLTSLREAVTMAQDGDIIQFGQSEYGYDIRDVTLSSSLVTTEDITIQGTNVSITIYDAEGTLELSGFHFEGVGIRSFASTDVILSNSTFSGEYAYSVVENYGSFMTLNGVEISGVEFLQEIEDTFEDGNYEDYAEVTSGTASIIVNMYDSSMSINDVTIVDNSMEANADRVDAWVDFIAITNFGELEIDCLTIGENEVLGTSNRGDIDVTFTGIFHAGSSLDAKNLLIYGNSADAVTTDARFETVAAKTTQVVSIDTQLKDVDITNSTLLENFQGYRADFYITNSIYLAEGNYLDRGFIIGESNLEVSSEDLSGIFAFYNSETGLFDNRDYRIWANASVVDAGNNQYASAEGSDLLGNDRIAGGTVDIGAVESQAYKLTISGADAYTADGTAALNTIVFEWDDVDAPTSYVLRYYTGTEELSEVADEDWTYVREGFIVSGGTVSFTLTGLEQGTWAGFQVMAVGDNIETTDSDWSAIASAQTESIQQWAAPGELVASLKDVNVIDLAWYRVPNAPGYSVEYRVKVEEGETENPWTQADEEDFSYEQFGGFVLGNLAYDTMYEFRVKVVADENTLWSDSEWVYAEKKTGIQLSPVVITQNDATGTSVSISWTDETNDPDKVSGYAVEYSEDGVNWTPVLEENISGTSATIDGLNAGTDYFVRVKALGVARVSADSEWAVDENVSTKPQIAAPQISAEATGATTISVQWSAVENATGYVLDYSVAEDELWSSANVVVTPPAEGETTWTASITGLTPEMTYNIRVVAQGSEDYIDSTPATAKATTWAKLSTPTLSIVEKTTCEIEVSWAESLGAAGYEVQYSLTEPTDGTTWTELTISGDGLSAMFVESPDVPASQAVWFRIRSLGADGISETSDWSAPISGATLEKLVWGENAATATATGTTTILVEWAAVEGASGYQVSYQTGNENPVTTNFDANVLSNTFSGLEEGTLYNFYVTALGADDVSADSDPAEASATTWVQLPAPTLTAGDRTTASVSVLWGEIAGANGYQLEYKTSEDGDWLPLTPNEGELSGTFSEAEDVPQSATVWFRVKALGVDGTSVASEYSDVLGVATLEKLVVDTTSVSAVATSATTIDVTWSAVEGATGYEVKYQVGENWVSTGVTLSDVTTAATISGLNPDTTYNISVIATGDGVTTVDSEPALTSATTWVKLTAPELSVSERTAVSVTVTWEATEGASGYELQYKTSEEGDWVDVTLNSDGLSGTFTESIDIDEKQPVWFQIRALGADGVSETSAWCNPAFDSSTLERLSWGDDLNASATATSATTINVSWDSVPNASGYKVEYQVGDDWVTTNVSSTGSNSATISGLNPETEYGIRVIALGDQIDYVNSNPAETSAMTWIQLLPPTLTAGERTTDSVSVSWNAIANANRYQLQYKTSENGVWTDLAPNADGLSGTFSEAEDVPQSATIWFQIRAIGATGVSADSVYSEVLTMTTLEKLVVNTQEISAVATGATTIDVTWSAVDGAIGYDVEYQVGENWVSTGVTLSDVTTAATIGGLDSATTYNIRVIAKGDGTTTVDSDPALTSATTWILLEPQMPQLAGKTDTTISLSWAADTNASGYVLKYIASDAPEGTAWTFIETTTTSCEITGLSANTTYQFHLQSVGIDGVSETSEFSDNLDVTTKDVLSAPVASAETTGTTTINLSWTDVENADSFLVEWKKASEETWNTANGTATQNVDSSWTLGFSGLTSGTTYQFRVTAVAAEASEFVNSAVSNVAEATTLVQIAAPTITFGTITDVSIQLSWNTIENASEYVVSYWTGENAPQDVYAGPNTTFTLNSLSPNTEYSFVVTAKTTTEGFCNSEASETATATTLKDQLATPEVSVAYVDENVVVSWDSVPNATGYVLSYRIKGTEDWTDSNVLSTDTLSGTPLNDLSAGTTYEFRVTAIGDENTNGSVSDTVEFVAPDTVGLEGIIVREPSATGATTKPEPATWVDEWMNVYLEIWSDDTASILAGREFEFTFAVDDMYDVSGVSAANGFEFSYDDATGVWTITTSATFVAGEGDTYFGRFALTPKNENGVSWSDRVKEDAVEFNAVGVLDVYAVPGDLDDDGTILLDYSSTGTDNILMDAELAKTESYANFDGSEYVSLGDRGWMLENNYGKSFFGDRNVVYHEDFTFAIAPVYRAPSSGNVVLPAASENPVEKTDWRKSERRGEREREIPCAPEADPIPVVKDANRLSGNGRDVDSLRAASDSTSEAVDMVFSEYHRHHRSFLS
ncbi:MAG: DUF4992 family lipoprotein [Planctomycetia bacterium]|nr:DUF4992 family lipoprotein [Planctomycetia bacterium]